MATGSFRLPSGGSTVTADDWVRPSDWLAMPTIGTQEFIGLLAITNDESNHIALLCAGAYTVDWGDGVTENVATGVKAQHTYTYSAISSGTLSTRGYKQVLVRVTPQAGQNLTTVNLQQQNSILAKAHTVGWLDIAIKGSNITSLVLGGSTVYQGMCENVDIYSMGNVTSFSGLFSNFYSLQKLTLPSTSTVNNLYQSFNNCYSLKSIPFFNTTNVTTFGQSFNGCFSLITMPLLDFTNGTSFDSTFASCLRMQYYPLFNTAKGTYFGFMFSGNNSLQQLPNLSTVLGTNFSTMLGNCNSLAKGAFQGTRYAISYTNMCLSQSAIVDIFNGLGTAVGTPTVNVSSNPGRAALTAGEILIATSKGWIVV
jgi:hypothetical protein